MSAPQTRQRPAGTGREVEQQIALARRLYGSGRDSTSARARYRGTTPPPTAPTPRDSAAIAADLAEAATRLRAIAGGIRLGGPTPGALADADGTVTGCGRLVAELRQRVTP